MKLKNISIAVLCLSAVVAASAYALLTTRTTANTSLTMTELQVKNMTCGSCVAKITEALDAVSGVESIDVSVTTGTGKITFDPQLVTAQALAETVTSAGYPATIKQLLTSEQYHLLLSEESRLSADYVARIGDQLISRSRFDREVGKYLTEADQQDRPEAHGRALAQAWQGIMQRTLLLQAADKNQVVVHDGEVALRIQQLRQGMPKLDEYIRSRYGSAENFHQQLKEDMVISRNIDQSAIGTEKDPRRRQKSFNLWFQSLVDNASIIIYDQRLKQATASAGGCGGVCCG